MSELLRLCDLVLLHLVDDVPDQDPVVLDEGFDEFRELQLGRIVDDGRNSLRVGELCRHPLVDLFASGDHVLHHDLTVDPLSLQLEDGLEVLRIDLHPDIILEHTSGPGCGVDARQ